MQTQLIGGLDGTSFKLNVPLFQLYDRETLNFWHHDLKVFVFVVDYCLLFEKMNSFLGFSL